MHDIPYVHGNEIGPEIVSMMTRICTSVRQLVPEHIPCGLQVGSKYIIPLENNDSSLKFRY